METMNLRLIGCGALCLTIGIVAGYGLGAARTAAEHLPKETPAIVPPSMDGAARLAGVAAATPDGSVATNGNSISPESAKAIARLEALRWFKRNGQTFFTVGVFSNPQNGELATGFVSAYGLTPEDGRRLRDALVAARARLDRGRYDAAKVEVRPDNLGAVIHVPALPELGGAAYDEVLTTLRTVLGPDRWAYFEEFSADTFEHGFLRFGAMENRLEIEVKQRPDGAEFFEVKDHFFGTDLNGWTGSTLDPGSFHEFFPFAAKLLPQSFLRTQPTQ